VADEDEDDYLEDVAHFEAGDDDALDQLAATNTEFFLEEDDDDGDDLLYPISILLIATYSIFPTYTDHIDYRFPFQIIVRTGSILQIISGLNVTSVICEKMYFSHLNNVFSFLINDNCLLEVQTYIHK